MPIESLLLFTAGLLGGILNSIAGGGTFITFPALLIAGVPPISANATNTFAVSAGYISGTWALRQELSAHKKALPGIIFISLAGGLAGAWLLLQTPEQLFRQAIPWLLLFATLLFIYGENINRFFAWLDMKHRHASVIAKGLSVLMLLSVTTYGGFFNAGLGIVILSYLSLAGYSNINEMNGIKLLISSVVSLIAVVIFMLDDVIAWYEGSIVLLGSLAGGYLAAHYSRSLSQTHVRIIVIIISVLITTYYFYQHYL
ncbi:MAG: sulfite exporter TauE/SafE family protein [Gammaproteobacteria bacterium]|nr:sulfite exporter TauE/SafE family protein [Gammaproteobacteria bacterium]NNJ91214.1 sulfite exporter TauE/SafE family protein [Gammaproteobacteria bacterium]